jgi:uncharacterized protein (DUF1501 family)
MEPSMNHKNCGCEEFEALERGLSRRGFIGSVMALGGGLLLTDPTGVQYAMAATGDTNTDVVITISMRGGMDGIMAVQPLGDPRLKTLRPTLSLADNQTLALDSHFGLHKNLVAFKRLFDQGELAIVHAVGTPVGTRSHFDDQNSLELAAYNNPGLASGWQNRFLGELGTTDALSGISTTGNRPVTLMGPSPAAVFEKTSDVVIHGLEAVSRKDYLQVLRDLHVKNSHQWGRTAAATITSAERLAKVNPATSVVYPATTLGNRMKSLASLIKSGIPVKTANVDFGGNLDVHSDAGPITGTMANNFTDLSESIAAFKADIAADWNRVTIVTITEFGRRLQENASAGLDHGWGSAMFVAGGGVKGGKVVANWPGLEGSNLRDGDLAVTLDYRHVLAEVMRYRAGMTSQNLSNILPGFKPMDLGLVRNLS